MHESNSVNESYFDRFVLFHTVHVGGLCGRFLGPAARLCLMVVRSKIGLNNHKHSQRARAAVASTGDASAIDMRAVHGCDACCTHTSAHT